MGGAEPGVRWDGGGVGRLAVAGSCRGGRHLQGARGAGKFQLTLPNKHHPPASSLGFLKYFLLRAKVSRFRTVVKYFFVGLYVCRGPIVSIISERMDKPCKKNLKHS